MRLLSLLLAHQAAFVIARAGYDQAVKAAQEAIDLGEQEGADRAVAAGYLHWGVALWYQGDLAAAQPLLEKALHHSRRGCLPRLEIDSLRAIGSVYLRLGEYEMARDHYDQALQQARQRGDRRRESQALNSLGSIARNLACYDDARRYLEQGLAIQRLLGDRRGETGALNSLGDVAYYQGYYLTARAYYEQTLEIALELGDRRSECIATTNLGLIYRDLGDYDSAQRYLNSSVALTRSIGFHRGSAWALTNLGLLHHQIGENAAAIAHGRRAVRLFEQLGDRIGHAYALTHLGHALLEQNKIKETRRSYTQAFALRRELNQPHLALETQAGLVRVALAEGVADEAFAHAEAILRYAEQHPLHGLDEPVRVYLTTVQALQVAGDNRAEKILVDARMLLDRRAAHIREHALRRTYLEMVLSHRTLSCHARTIPATPA